RPVSFRLAPEASVPVRTTTELERQLRRRLRVIAAIICAATASLAAATIVLHRADIRDNPMSVFTGPPLPGVLAIVALLSLAMFATLRPVTQSLRRLRMIESAGTGMITLFLLMNQSLSLPAMIPDFFGLPMEVGMAQGAPWGALIVSFGVLIPSSFRRAATRTAIIATLAFLPDLVLLPGAGPFHGVMSYLAIKLFIIGIMSALGIYGSYRIEELGQQAEVARELGQYLLRRSLGEGGMGSVYLAEHRFLRRPCAVKLIHAEKANDEVALARFEREVQSAASLTHPNTVQIYDYGRSDDGTFFFAMEFLPGVSLDELVTKHGPLDPARAVHILVQLCGALQEAHDQGMVHRDVKPGNVMLCDRGGVADVAKLLDFGLVGPVQVDESDARVTQAGLVMGTPAYMSPEQCAGDEAVTAASDIYSLGSLGYFLLSGKPPFAGKAAMQMLIAHLHDVPPRLTDLRQEVPAELADALARCLEKKPGDRFPSVSDLAAALVHSVRTAEWRQSDAREWWAKR
ncbi:MAG: serine/threonine-protein kinase, partial [Gemmatimonadaceae bacterium]